MGATKIITTEGELVCFAFEVSELPGFLRCHTPDGVKMVNTEFIIEINLDE